jgi:deoxyadenosine/deoxycytidine kinase
MTDPSSFRVAVVGVCASGKSTLVRGLKELGYEAYSVAQEHSFVPYLWSRRDPSFLIVLDAEYETVQQRRSVSYGPDRLAEQRQRLSHASAHGDLLLATDRLTIDEVRAQAVAAIEARRSP